MVQAGAVDTPKDKNGDNIMPEGGDISAGNVIDVGDNLTLDDNTEVSQGTVTSTNSTNKTKTVKGVTKKDMLKSKNPVSRDNVGDSVKRFESANEGPGTISEPSGADLGGHSYGSYQITNKNIDEYIEYLENTGTESNLRLAKDLKGDGRSRGARNPDSVVGTSGKTFREVWERSCKLMMNLVLKIHKQDTYQHQTLDQHSIIYKRKQVLILVKREVQFKMRYGVHQLSMAWIDWEYRKRCS